MLGNEKRGAKIKGEEKGKDKKMEKRKDAALDIAMLLPVAKKKGGGGELEPGRRLETRRRPNVQNCSAGKKALTSQILSSSS